MPALLRRPFVLLAVIAVIVVAILALRPVPVDVETSVVSRGFMRVTVDEDGQTRIRERYTVSAPLAGRLRRIVLDPGDVVTADTTVLAVIEPTNPAFLDARARAEAEARVSAAAAAVSRADAALERAKSAYGFAENELARVRNADAAGGVTSQEVDEKTYLQQSAYNDYRAAQFARDIATFELEQTRSALLFVSGEVNEDGQPQFEIRAPVSGSVLRVFEESVAIVSPGEQLLEVGDPTDLEIVIDVLSTDAVRIPLGADVDIVHWGGDPLRATVRRVEPSAFTKVSALGVEEQRVNVILEFVSPLEDRRALGDGFRVEAEIVVWSAEDVVQVPAGALFREAGAWTVYVVDGGRARARTVEIGAQNGLTAEVRDGLGVNDEVIVHPGDRVSDGGRVRVRE